MMAFAYVAVPLLAWTVLSFWIGYMIGWVAALYEFTQLDDED